jgi:hypothetical protein
MNRSILIVIIDFLLVSLLLFSTVDINKTVDPNASGNINLTMQTQASGDTNSDLTAVMRLALEEEQKRRNQIITELTQAQATNTQRETQIASIQKQLQTREQEAARLQQQQQEGERRQAELQQRITAAEANVQSLNQQLQSSSTETVLTREKLAAMEAEAKKHGQEASELQRQLAQLNETNRLVQQERQQLATQLQVAQVEKKHASEQVAKMQEEVKTEREEKAKLAEGVKALASRSSDLEKEVRENRPLSPNTIFSDFLSNRVDASFVASRSGLLGVDATKRKETATVLVTNGTNTFALCHIQETPLSLWNPGTSWESLTGNLTRNLASVPIRSLSFFDADPRIVSMPISSADAQRLGGKVYRLSSDPFKFQDAILVGAKEGYYGECRFEIDPGTPDYFKLDHNFLKGIFGKFNPSRGDLVFSKTGELLGIMANGSYCLRVQGLRSSTSIRFGPDVRDQNTGPLLSALYMQVFQFPQKLQ